jgi:hypothetical protein
MLNRYKHLGAPLDDLQGMKDHLDAAKGLPDKVKLQDMPKGPNYPTVTKYPPSEVPTSTDIGKIPEQPPPANLKSFDPVEARKVALKEISQSMGSMKGIRGYFDIAAFGRALTGHPEALTYPILRRLMAKGIGSDMIMNWLSKTTPEEMQAAKSIPAKKVALKMAQKSKP